MSDEILKRAKEKQGRGEKLSRDEQRAFDKWKREAIDRSLEQLGKACPKKFYVALSGRPHKVLDQQATRYQLPLLGDKLNLFDIQHRIHDLLAEFAKHGTLNGIPGKAGADDDQTDWANECKKEQALKARAERLALCGVLLRRQVVDATLQSVAALLRSAGERMQQQGHTDAHQLLDETLCEAHEQIDELLRQQPPLSNQLEAMED